MGPSAEGAGPNAIIRAAEGPYAAASMASNTFEDLLHGVERHADEEQEAILAYGALAQRTPDPALRVLLELLIADERKHHELFRSIAARLRDDLDWKVSAGALPVAGASVAGDAADRTFLLNAARDERRGAGELRRLARDRADLNGGLFSVLVGSMADDSEKHARILTYAAARIAGR